jgi:hypothetical protein
MNSKLFFGGVPTKIDIDRLQKSFGIPRHGDLLRHDDISKVIDVDKKSARYRTVVNQWRRILLNEHGIELASETGVGYKVLSDPERVDHGGKRFGRSVRATVRSAKMAAMIPLEKLEGVDKKKAEHLKLATMRIAEAATDVNRSMKIEWRVSEQLPRPRDLK